MTRQYPTVWIDVTGLRDIDRIRLLGELLGLHPLAMEDVVNVHQRAKLDSFEKYLFLVARMIDREDTGDSEQISFFLLPGVLISFQERPGDCWEPVRNRLRQRRGKYCSLGPDYLLMHCSMRLSIATFLSWIGSASKSTKSKTRS